MTRTRIRTRNRTGLVGEQIDKARREAHDSGYKEGEEVGYQAGFDVGYKQAYDKGRASAEALFEEAKRQEYVKGHSHGKDDGYRVGYEKAMDVIGGTQTVLQVGITPEFIQGWNAMLALVEQQVISVTEMEWFEQEFKRIIAPDALDVLQRTIGKGQRGK